MSKKKLLEEGTVRQFMKLANLKPLTSGFINENYMDEELYEQEEEMEDELPPEAGMEDEMDMDMASDEEAPMDMDMEAEGESALAGVSEEVVEELIGVVANALASATGVEIDVTGGEEGMEGMEGEEGMDMAPEDEEGMDFAPAVDGEEGEDEEVALEGIDMVDEDAIMKETYRRVTRRLTGMNKQHKLVESVTNRIMQRLNKSR
jgi:hypothetical protein